LMLELTFFPSSRFDIAMVLRLLPRESRVYRRRPLT
jgi:hypothetical protein